MSGQEVWSPTNTSWAVTVLPSGLLHACVWGYAHDSITPTHKLWEGYVSPGAWDQPWAWRMEETFLDTHRPSLAEVTAANTR